MSRHLFTETETDYYTTADEVFACYREVRTGGVDNWVGVSRLVDGSDRIDLGADFRNAYGWMVDISNAVVDLRTATVEAVA